MTRAVACPVVLHPDGAPRRLAAFTHPLAGSQLVKGGIKLDETPEHAALRELLEESGLTCSAVLYLGACEDIQPGEIWHFSLCRVTPPVRAAWQHHCADDGGHLFRFFWQTLDDPPTSGFEPRFLRAMDWIRTEL